MLEHLGEVDASKTLMMAIEKFTLDGIHFPKDLGGTSTTKEVTNAILRIIENKNDFQII
jgi:tartrate dehydrogenase/decarboxylase/D-malate dehydrogenase